MKIYTKTGDDGTTALYGGMRLSKADLRIEAYGTVDELNSHLGIDIGTHLAAEPGKKNLILPEINESNILTLETYIDKMNEDLEELKYFILPSGNFAIGHCHVARTVCRRAERCIVRLSENDIIEPILSKYLNRLSDFLFVLARKFAKDAALPEIIWKAH